MIGAFFWIATSFFLQMLGEAEKVQVEQRFPFGANYHPGRWFPVEFRILSPEDWRGELAVVCPERGSLSSKSIHCNKNELTRIWLPVLLSSQPGKIEFHLGDQNSELLPPIPSAAHNLLLVGNPEERARLREQVKNESWATQLGSTSELDPRDIPLDLYLLDSIDYIAIGDTSIATLPPGALEMLSKWGTLRGRVFTTQVGRKQFTNSKVDPQVFEVLDAERPENRRLPWASLPPFLDRPLYAKDLTTLSDPPGLLLAIYLVVAVVLIWKKSGKTISALALAAGIVAALESVPGIGWKAGPKNLLNAVCFESENRALCEEYRYVATSQKIEKQQEELWVPNSYEYEIRFHPQVPIMICPRGWRVYSVAELGELNLSRSSGNGIRNRFGDLQDLRWAVGSMGILGHRESFSFGDVLEANDAETKGFSARRPQQDYLAANWVRGEWLMGRVSKPSSIGPISTLSSGKEVVTLIWLPRAF